MGRGLHGSWGGLWRGASRFSSRRLPVGLLQRRLEVGCPCHSPALPAPHLTALEAASHVSTAMPGPLHLPAHLFCTSLLSTARPLNPQPSCRAWTAAPSGACWPTMGKGGRRWRWSTRQVSANADANIADANINACEVSSAQLPLDSFPAGAGRQTVAVEQETSECHSAWVR